MNLTNIQCKSAKYNPNGAGNKLSAGGGLFLHVKENGKYWRLNYRFLGKQKTLAIGTYPRIIQTISPGRCVQSNPKNIDKSRIIGY